MTSARPIIHDLPFSALAATMEAMELPRFRARQVWRWLYVDYADSFDAMTNLPRDLRSRLNREFVGNPFQEIETRKAPDGTGKQLLETQDGHGVETVMIPARPRRTVCVSSQIGCPVGCVFCASAKGGYVRDLSVGEITAQVTAAARWFGERPTHVVFMGMGEPLLNLDAVLTAARVLNDAEGLGIAARRITLSTSGIVPGIRRLAAERTQFELSVSLHAADDPTRSRLMPINRQWPIETLLDACRDYTRQTRRLITFEYTLIAGVNDAPAHAHALTRHVRLFPCRINLIPLSPIEDFLGTAPGEPQIQRFCDIIQSTGINVTVRRSRGGAVDAACGQLRQRHRPSPPSS